MKFAANAVEEFPGDEDTLAWEHQLLDGHHDPDFNIRAFLVGSKPEGEQEHPPEPDEDTEVSDSPG